MSVTVKKSAKQLQIQVSALNSVSWLIVLGCFGCQVVTLKSKDAKNEIPYPFELDCLHMLQSQKDTGNECHRWWSSARDNPPQGRCCSF